MQLISLAEVLAVLNNTADPCTITFSTANRTTGTGGELVTLEGCVKTGVDKYGPAGARPAPSEPAAALPKWTEQLLELKRRPAHKANQTINLTILSSGHVRKAHVRLITEFNGQKVRW